jgi:hypothetical protein
MGLGRRGLAEVLVQVGEDLVLTNDGGAVLEHERGDRVGAGGRVEVRALVPVDGDLAVDVVEPELRQSLPDPPRGGTPLRLEQLEHRQLALGPRTTWRSDSTRCCRLPQTVSQSPSTPASAIE